MAEPQKPQKLIDFIPDATVFCAPIMVYFLDRYFPIAQIIPSKFGCVGWIVVTVGIILAFYTISIIRQRNTTSNVTDVPPALMTAGLYSLSRNPFYCAYVLIALGAAVISGSLSALAVPAVGFIVLNWIVEIEEKNMLQAFGKEYEQYRRSVHRWI